MESTKPPWASKHAQPVPAHMGTGARPRLAALLFRPACARMERLAVVFSSSWIPLLQNVYANQNVMRENMVQQMCLMSEVEIESLQLNLWSLGLVWFIVTFHDVPFQ